MKTTFNRSEFLRGSGCYRETPGKAEKLIGDKESIEVNEILDFDIPLKDKFWFVRNNCQLSKEQYQKMAIGCAKIVLPIYEKKYPENKAPREAIEAAQKYLNGEIGLDELIQKRRAAADAAYAAAAAAADAAAADAAYAVDAAVDAVDAAAAYAVDAAYAAAAADAAAAAAADAAYAAAAAAADAAAADAAYAVDAAVDAVDAYAVDAAYAAAAYKKQLLDFLREIISEK